MIREARKDNAPENLAIIRHIALNLLEQEKSLKVALKVSVIEQDGIMIISSKS